MADMNTTVTVIDACGMAKVPALLLSRPGKGKSSLIRGLAAAQTIPCKVVLGSQYEPAEIGGLAHQPVEVCGAGRYPANIVMRADWVLEK